MRGLGSRVMQRLLATAMMDDLGGGRPVGEVYLQHAVHERVQLRRHVRERRELALHDPLAEHEVEAIRVEG